MRQATRFPTWLQNVAVVVGYFLAYTLSRVQLPYFAPQMGLRLACVLLLPRRYWLALLLGDILALSPVAYHCLDQYGWMGALTHIFPMIAFAMLPVWGLRAYLPSFEFGARTIQPITAKHICVLLTCMAVMAIFVAADSTIQEIALRLKLGQDHSLNALAAQACKLLLGSYLGCLTLTPLVLAAHEVIRTNDLWQLLVQRLARSRLLREGLMLGLLCLVLLAALAAGKTDDTWRQVMRMGMFLFVAWMAVRYGWQGVAVSGTAASVGIMLTMPSVYDSSTILAQAFMVFVLTILLPLGAYINTLKEEKQDAQQAATHDMLTGLPNRLLFSNHLHVAITRASRHGGNFAVAMVDLDGFKPINDQYGHLVGDAMLQEAAARLRGALRASDTVARYGGDEFVLLFEDVTDVAALQERCQQLVATLAMPYRLTGQLDNVVLQSSASIGIALGANYDEEQLIHVADQALYQAKKAGKNRWVLADQAISSTQSNRYSSDLEAGNQWDNEPV